VNLEPDPVAERLAQHLRRMPGVGAVQVRSREGDLIGALPDEGPDVDSAWAGFVVRRAEMLGDGDLRGWGPRINQGRLQRIVISGDAGETLVLHHGERYIWLTLDSTALSDSVEPIVRRALQQYD
jgi:hypothetical protein